MAMFRRPDTSRCGDSGPLVSQPHHHRNNATRDEDDDDDGKEAV